ncbi:hypothetical protein Tco_0559645 [Tanacetum coccineum]
MGGFRHTYCSQQECTSAIDSFLTSFPVVVVIVVWFLLVFSGVPVGPVFLLGLLVPTIVATCTSRAAGMIHNDDDRDDDAKEINRYYETTSPMVLLELILCLDASEDLPYLLDDESEYQLMMCFRS